MAMTGFQDFVPPVVTAAFLNLVDASKNLFTDAGTVNNINVQSGIPGGLSLNTDMSLHIKIGFTNTLQSVVLTLDLNPQIQVLNTDGSQPALAQLIAGAIVEFKFDGANFQILSVTDTLFGNGTAADPSISFTNSESTGFYLAGTNTLGGATAGVSRWTLDANGCWILNAPTGGTITPTVTLNSANVVGQTAFQIIANSNFQNAMLALDDLNDGTAAMTELALGCGVNAATKSPVGMITTNRNYTGTPLLAITGPVGGFGMFQQQPWNFGLFFANEMRLLLPPSVAGGGVWCYSANSVSFSDMTIDRGSFTGTLSGMSSTTTGPVNWIRRGTEIEIWLGTGLLGTSSTTAMVLSGLPAVITPVNTSGINNQNIAFYGIVDQGVSQMGQATPQTNNTIIFNLLQVNASRLISTAFTASGSKGLAVGTSFKYKTQATS